MDQTRLAQGVPAMTASHYRRNLSTEDKAKADAYSLHYLLNFQSEVRRLQAELDVASKRLVIAEKEFADGHMVTGEASGVPRVMQGMPRVFRGASR
jgi:hypothetical protein